MVPKRVRTELSDGCHSTIVLRNSYAAVRLRRACRCASLSTWLHSGSSLCVPLHGPWFLTFRWTGIACHGFLCVSGTAIIRAPLSVDRRCSTGDTVLTTLSLMLGILPGTACRLPPRPGLTCCLLESLPSSSSARHVPYSAEYLPACFSGV